MELFVKVTAERKRGSKTKDSTTGVVYPSRNKTYKALAPGLGLDPNDPYGWYTLCRMFPGRFVDVRTGRQIGARGSLGSEAEVHVGPQGRMVIPVSIRETLDLRPGDSLTARIEDGQLVLEKREHILKRLKVRFGKVPSEASMVEELIEERRAEAGQEERP